MGKNYEPAKHEPVCHSHITDQLAEGHPLAYERVYCERCDYPVHAAHNECNATWFEYCDIAVCGNCFAEYLLLCDNWMGNARHFEKWISGELENTESARYPGIAPLAVRKLIGKREHEDGTNDLRQEQE